MKRRNGFLENRGIRLVEEQLALEIIWTGQSLLFNHRLTIDPVLATSLVFSTFWLRGQEISLALPDTAL